MSRAPLPPSLGPGPFAVREALLAGVHPGRLRGKDLSIPTRGARAPHADDASSATRFQQLLATARAVAVALPSGHAYSHLTAAGLWRLPLPPALDRSAVLHVMRPTETDRVRRQGCRGHRGLERRDVREVDGIRLTGLADTWVDLGEVLHLGLRHDDLVMAGDAAACRLGGVGPIRDALLARNRPRGKRRLVAALADVRHPVRSPMETRARLTIVRAGLPEPAVNVVIVDAYGGWLMEADLVWERERVLAEYQGEHHATIAQRGTDAVRRRLAEGEGWTVVEVFAADVRPGVRGRALLRHLADALGLEPTTVVDPWPSA